MTSTLRRLLATYTAGVIRARRAYTPDQVLYADDCRIPGCTRPSTARGGTCRGHRDSPHPAILPSDRR